MKTALLLIFVLLVSQTAALAAPSVPRRLTGGHHHGCGRHISVVSSRRLLQNIMSGSPSGALSQLKTLGKTVTTDLKEIEAHSADYMAPKTSSRFSKGDRRLLQNIMSGSPSGALSQLKTLDKTVTADLKETEAHSADYMAPKTSSRFSKGSDR